MGVCILYTSTCGCNYSSIKKNRLQVKKRFLTLKYGVEFLKEIGVIIMLMCTYISIKRWVLTGLLFMLFLFAGCVRNSPVEETKPLPNKTQTATEFTPTVTTEPMAVLVNGEGVSLADYDAEINRLQLALNELGQTMTEEEQRQQVLDMLIDTTLLEQSAVASGHTITDAEMESKVEELAAEMGDTDTLQNWMSTYGYDDASLARTLKRSMLAAWQSDQITATVGDTADQVHARQIMVPDEATANSYYAQLQAGIDFATLAAEVDPLTGGELGWFPEGYLLQPELNQVVFTLNSGEYSSVIKTQIGYHIIQVIERDSQHPLTMETRQFLQHKALENWLTEQKAKATIEVLVP
jgi:peptidyl-prolyl cis-trans isomerase C